MTSEKPKLSPYTLKIKDSDRKAVKLICLEKCFYQYQLLDTAVAWALENKETLVAIANPLDGQHRSFYVSDSVKQLAELEDAWNCNSTRALYTALISYIKFYKAESMTANAGIK
jgi:hypothetical protein